MYKENRIYKMSQILNTQTKKGKLKNQGITEARGVEKPESEKKID